MAKFSTGLRNQMLDTNSFQDIMDGGFIKIYSGPAPTNADAAIGSAGANTLLVTISVDGDGVTGLTFGSASGGTISKTGAEVWSGTVAANGTASFYRLTAAGDTGTASTTEARVQGTVGQTGADMNFINGATLAASAEQRIDYYILRLPDAA